MASHVPTMHCILTEEERQLIVCSFCDCVMCISIRTNCSVRTSLLFH